MNKKAYSTIDLSARCSAQIGIKMNQKAAKEFILTTGRPLEKALYRFYFEQGSQSDVILELKKFQNADGGFGNGLEADNWNPNSNPIATNDAIILLDRIQALDEAEEMLTGILRYLRSHDSFNEEEQKWLFAIDSNKDYPHAIWWEKDGDGIDHYNPTVSLAAVMICFGEERSYYEDIVKAAFEHLQKSEIQGDGLKCYLLCYRLLSNYHITDVINLTAAKELITQKLNAEICRDTAKYGVEYVAVPSDFFAWSNTEFINQEIQELIDAELAILDQMQKEDGGFDISWQWYTPYKEEFELARAWWRPRITIDKLLFEQQYSRAVV